MSERYTEIRTNSRTYVQTDGWTDGKTGRQTGRRSDIVKIAKEICLCTVKRRPFKKTK